MRKSSREASPATLVSTWTAGDDNITASLPGLPQQLDSTPLLVTVRDRAGQPVPVKAVTAILTMPSMSMPDNRIALASDKTGAYRGDVRFTMSGAWRVTLVVLDTQGHSAAYSMSSVEVE